MSTFCILFFVFEFEYRTSNRTCPEVFPLCAEETDRPVQHLFLDNDEDPELVARLQAAVTELVGAEDQVQSLEEHPLVRKVLHKYARAKHSAGFGLPSKLYSENSKCEVLGEFTGMQGTPPTVPIPSPM